MLGATDAAMVTGEGATDGLAVYICRNMPLWLERIDGKMHRLGTGIRPDVYRFRSGLESSRFISWCFELRWVFAGRANRFAPNFVTLRFERKPKYIGVLSAACQCCDDVCERALASRLAMTRGTSPCLLATRPG